MSKTKNNLLKYQSVGGTSGVSGDMTASITTKATNIQHLDDIGYQFNYTGSPTGSFSIQVSIDYAQDFQGNVQVAGNWVNLTFTYWNGSAFVTATSIPASVGSPIYLDLALLSAPWIRAHYTSDASAGTLTAFISAKEV